MAVVGAGFTGLWTAHYLAEADPSLRIAVLEAETVGFGASGRNGGWCSALFPASLGALARMSDPEAALAQHAAMRQTVDEVGAVAAAEGLDVDYAKGGTISLVRNRAQLVRAREDVAQARRWGLGPDQLDLLDEDRARAMLDGSGTLAGLYTPDCAALHPLRLARGLAAAASRRGVHIHEHSRATRIGPGRVETPAGTVHAGTVVRATEAFTAGLPGERRTLAPVYSLVIATEPLPAETWERIGLARRETFADHRHLVIYGQRTADDRLVFGGRGAPYHLGSRMQPGFEHEPRVFAQLRSTLVDLLPVLRDARFTHAWGGAVGVPRDWCASVGLDRDTRIGWAGGYVGDGVGTTNLAGRTLRDLVLDRDTELTRLPWVGHRSRRWEPEPLRWLGINAGLHAITWADREERLTRRPSLIARAVRPLVGS
ncbi:NAD(P)/FAD-dependent oxidoreductase [Nocardioides euryhalodurans]|uniref:NAD(P)/FAD-dependent oxidoreductase n=1 Tax=Nocardioides euryhalodurans TaxID=2518370 RepID=UPI001FC9C565|nr:FAD-binding oxidoreductase [Nocardioides euryhalodurans]